MIKSIKKEKIFDEFETIAGKLSDLQGCNDFESLSRKTNEHVIGVMIIRLPKIND